MDFSTKRTERGDFKDVTVTDRFQQWEFLSQTCPIFHKYKRSQIPQDGGQGEHDVSRAPDEEIVLGEHRQPPGVRQRIGTRESGVGWEEGRIFLDKDRRNPYCTPVRGDIGSRGLSRKGSRVS